MSEPVQAQSPSPQVLRPPRQMLQPIQRRKQMTVEPVASIRVRARRVDVGVVDRLDALPPTHHFDPLVRDADRLHRRRRHVPQAVVRVLEPGSPQPSSWPPPRPPPPSSAQPSAPLPERAAPKLGRGWARRPAPDPSAYSALRFSNRYIWEYRVGQPNGLESTASAAAESCTKSA